MPVALRQSIRWFFLLWAGASTLWLANSIRTQGVDASLLQDGPALSVLDRPQTLEFIPAGPKASALIFICGSGISADAYAPLLRPVAEAGHRVFVVRLPYRFAPLDAHKDEAVARVQRLIAGGPTATRWVVSGHSLGAALAARLARPAGTPVAGVVLIGTTHPKQDDLSALAVPVTKVYATHDGIAPVDRVMANQRLLPPHTQWVEIAGGNHSQFGHYGRQLFDGSATIGREAQQAATRTALLEALARAAGP